MYDVGMDTLRVKIRICSFFLQVLCSTFLWTQPLQAKPHLGFGEWCSAWRLQCQTVQGAFPSDQHPWGEKQWRSALYILDAALESGSSMRLHADLLETLKSRPAAKFLLGIAPVEALLQNHSWAYVRLAQGYLEFGLEKNVLGSRDHPYFHHQLPNGLHLRFAGHIKVQPEVAANHRPAILLEGFWLTENKGPFARKLRVEKIEIDCQSDGQKLYLHTDKLVITDVPIGFLINSQPEFAPEKAGVHHLIDLLANVLTDHAEQDERDGHIAVAVDALNVDLGKVFFTKAAQQMPILLEETPLAAKQYAVLQAEELSKSLRQITSLSTRGPDPLTIQLRRQIVCGYRVMGQTMKTLWLGPEIRVTAIGRESNGISVQLTGIEAGLTTLGLGGKSPVTKVVLSPDKIVVSIPPVETISSEWFRGLPGDPLNGFVCSL